MQDIITSRDNPLFKRLKKLAESARERRQTRMTLLDGEHLIAAYLDAGGQPQTLIYAASCADEVWTQLAARCTQAKSLALADALFAEISPVATPTGLLAEAAWLSPSAPASTPLIVVLEEIQDPGNLGAMLRTAAAAGATQAVLSKACHDPWSPKALRGGQGAQFVLPVLTGIDLPGWLMTFDGLSVALALNQKSNFYAQDFRGALAFVAGNEGAGLSQAVIEATSVVVQIPMPGKVESLNASAALAVAVFEAVRQRRV